MSLMGITTRLRSTFFVLALAVLPANAQEPNGTIAGVVTDSSGATVAGALVTIVNRVTGLARHLTASSEGDYSGAALPSGVYTVTVEAPGFGSVERTATVEAGTTTTVNFVVRPGVINETSTVNDAVPLIQYEHHQLAGVVKRIQIETLPLNGRNFLELAKLEPGVTSPMRGPTNRVFVPILGAGVLSTPRIGYTRVTVDGGDISIVGTFGAALQVSQEVVEEFQISTVNFDASTNLTTNGAINIVTRSGGNSFHGESFYFYRDHNLAAYPGLQRDPTNPDPFFQRKQFGYLLGGPIHRDQVFFFSSFERNDERGVESIQPLTPEFASLGGLFPSPFLENQFNLRFDLRTGPNHNALVRYTHDGNRAFAPNGPLLPSGWTRTTNWADQSLFALTSVLSPELVNDVRFSYFFISPRESPATDNVCGGCFGLGAPRINIQDAVVSFGDARRISGPARRYQLTESLTWQRRDHRFRFGFDWEHSTVSVELLDRDPATIDLYSPREVREANAMLPPASQIPLPESFLRVEDVLRLPLRSFVTAVGPGLFLQREFRKNRVIDLYRLYGADTWQINQRLSVNFGLGWSYEPNVLNTDLSKPKLLVAILGSRGLNPPSAQTTNFSPTLGFAWAATRDHKLVIRAGTGRYFDPASFNSTDIANERFALSPAGTGRRTIPGSAVFYQGTALDFRKQPTRFTGADLLAILPGIRAQLAQQLKTDNQDFTFRNIDLNKSGSNLSDPLYETPYAVHFNFGMQRELARDLVLSADFAWRRFVHTFISDVDYNRFNRRPNGPVIPLCTEAQKTDVAAVCSNGPITFDNTTGIAQYRGLLVRLEKRLSHGTQFLASYALGSYTGTNGAPGPGAPATGFNNDNWFENYGPLQADLRHILNLSGLVDLPLEFQLSFNVSAYSAPPLSAFVSGIDFNGDGTANDLLPGSKVNQFNRGFGKRELVDLVEAYNQRFAGRVTVGGQTAPRVALPGRFHLNDSFFTQDLRLSRSFKLRSDRARLLLISEVFNLLNTANLVGYDANIANPASFGQPSARFTQVFGSGGPRAFQLGARISF